MKGFIMSEVQSDKQNINATALVDKLEFIVGNSKKTGNEYLVGALYVKSPISDTPLRLSFDYIDDNVRELLKMAIKKFNVQAQEEFKEGISD